MKCMQIFKICNHVYSNLNS